MNLILIAYDNNSVLKCQIFFLKYAKLNSSGINKYRKAIRFDIFVSARDCLLLEGVSCDNWIFLLTFRYLD